MFSLVLIGNSTTRFEHGHMVTPRGYPGANSVSAWLYQLAAPLGTETIAKDSLAMANKLPTLSTPKGWFSTREEESRKPWQRGENIQPQDPSQKHFDFSLAPPID